MLKILLLTALVLIFIDGFSQSLVINEILTSNKTIISDGFGEYDDWIEIYNNSNESFNLGGMYITDDINNPTKHKIEQTKLNWTEIEPGEFLLLWLDGDPEQGIRHMPFRLKKDNGYIALFRSNGTLIDQISYGRQEVDVSYGRIPSENNSFALYTTPSPKQANSGGLKLTTESNKILYSVPSGFYDSTIMVELSSVHSSAIYYTLDGSDPTLMSNKYNEPIAISKTTVLKSCVIREGYSQPFSFANTYFINEKSVIPVLSLITDPSNLFDRKKGIYTKFEKRGWERPAQIEYFDMTNDGTHHYAFSKTVDIRISGKTSRRQQKKSFNLISNNLDSNNCINYQVFKDKTIPSFNSLCLRSDATSGRNVSDLWVGERFKNELLYEVNKEMSHDVDMQAYVPVLLFINGEYWGIYNLMERKGSDFIKDNHGVTDIDLITGEYVRVVDGNDDKYDEMIQYILTNDIRSKTVYDSVATMMVLSSYIDYWIYEVYSSTHDHRVNIRYWREKGTNHKWRWISYDQDSWNTYNENSFDRFIGNGEVLLLGELILNEQFRAAFTNRMCDYLNSGLSTENVLKLLEQITQRIEPEIQRERDRWQDSMLYMKKFSRINWMKEYAEKRPFYIREQMIDYFGFNGGQKEIEFLSNEGLKELKVNTLIIENFPWNGIYLENLPIKITVEPLPGYRFVGWKNRSLKKQKTIQVLPSEIKRIQPLFKRNRNS